MAVSIEIEVMSAVSSKSKERSPSFTQAIFIDPNHAENYYKYTSLYYLLDERQKFLKDFTVALDLFPKQNRTLMARRVLTIEQKMAAEETF